MFDESSEGSSITSTQQTVNPKKDKLDIAVEYINNHANKGIYKSSIKIGEYLLKHFFNNDIELATSNNPHKPSSYRQLCKREDLVLNPPAFSVMVRVAAQERLFETNGIDSDMLSYTVKAELIKLNGIEVNDKLALAKEIIDNKLTSRQVEEKVKSLRQKTETQSEPKLPLKYFDMLGKCFKYEVLEKFTFDLDSVKKSQQGTRDLLKKKAAERKDEMQEMIDRCDQLISAIENIEEEERRGGRDGEQLTVAAPQQ